MLQCFPTSFPRARFQQALEIQKVYNRLYCSIAEDDEWIFDAIRDLVPVEPLAGALWGIYETAKKEGFVQDISVGIFRSDYMLHLNGGHSAASPCGMAGTTLKQVEFNTFSCAGATHANKVADMHRYLVSTGVYNTEQTSFDAKSLPPNKNIQSIASCLALAHRTYGGPRSKLAKQTAVLFVVQPNNVSLPASPPSQETMNNGSCSLTSQTSGRLNMCSGIKQSPSQPIDLTLVRVSSNTLG